VRNGSIIQCRGGGKPARFAFVNDFRQRVEDEVRRLKELTGIAIPGNDSCSGARGAADTADAGCLRIAAAGGYAAGSVERVGLPRVIAAVPRRSREALSGKRQAQENEGRQNLHAVHSFCCTSHCSKLSLGTESAAAPRVFSVLPLATKNRKPLGVSITPLTSPVFCNWTRSTSRSSGQRSSNRRLSDGSSARSTAA